MPPLPISPKRILLIPFLHVQFKVRGIMPPRLFRGESASSCYGASALNNGATRVHSSGSPTASPNCSTQ
jgi:hypothetical protein